MQDLIRQLLVKTASILLAIEQFNYSTIVALHDSNGRVLRTLQDNHAVAQKVTQASFHKRIYKSNRS